LRVIAMASSLVPADRRREWRDEWGAEVEYRARRLPHGAANGMALNIRSAAQVGNGFLKLLQAFL